MSEYNFKITGYSVHLGERAPVKAKTRTGKEVGLVVNSVLTCRGDKGQRITVNFYRPGPKDEALVTAAHLGEDKKPAALIFEDQANYRNFIDLLRNESPIWGYIEIGKNDAEARIYTGRWEPVGVGDEDFRTDPTR